MNIAVISLTEKGRLLSLDISSRLGTEHAVTRYCSIRHCDVSCMTFSSLSDITRKLFDKYDALIYICAVGIAVRVCAPCIISKLSDPAVVAADDCGKFAVSVLSGHLGGANELTKRVAVLTGATPVITTATDIRGLIAPDVLAKDNDLVICGTDAAKAVAAALVNGDKVGIKCEYPHSDIPEELTECDSGDIGIRISDFPDGKPFDVTLDLIPRNIVAGIGCKKGTDCDSITTHIMKVFSENRMDIRRLCAVATIDIKSGEAGLREFCERFGLSLLTFSAEELMRAEGDFAHSDFVEKTTGADNVCERAAVCAGGTLTVRKNAGQGVTAALGELPVFIDFERKGDDRCFT